MNANGRVPMLEIVSLRHQYGAVVAVDDVSLAVAAGEFLTILGESGSGKTTILRVIAGLERPTSVARLAIAGEDVRELPAAKRNCTTVFQNYALFPHMSVGENVAYGLSVRGVPAAQAREEALKALEIVRLSGMADRRIAQLSGGQKQRAGAGALPRHPSRHHAARRAARRARRAAAARHADRAGGAAPAARHDLHLHHATARKRRSP